MQIFCSSHAILCKYLCLSKWNETTSSLSLYSELSNEQRLALRATQSCWFFFLFRFSHTNRLIKKKCMRIKAKDIRHNRNESKLNQKIWVTRANNRWKVTLLVADHCDRSVLRSLPWLALILCGLAIAGMPLVFTIQLSFELSCVRICFELVAFLLETKNSSLQLLFFRLAATIVKVFVSIF